ncbi:MAG: folate family ECF transporter S component [Ruminococcaceae bacterium]|nr:folate family ECF transporter S component [Oscillospiraceae bacterium]
MQNRISFFNRIKSSAMELKSTKSIVLCAALIALYVAINTLSVFVTQELKLGFSFLVLAVLGMQFGAITGTLAGFLCDLMAYIVRPMGALHLGFSLTTALTATVFAILLYRYELKLWRIIVSRIIINVFLNLLLNTIWLSQLYGNGFWALLPGRIFKNIGLLPIEIILLWIFLNAFKKAEKRL